MPILDNKLIPLDIYERAFKAGYRGTFLGGCISRGEGSSIRRSAHCHSLQCKYFGWICIKSKKAERCVKPNGKPTLLFLHELAHLICEKENNGKAYGKKFFAIARSLGYRRMKYDHKE
jgi:hypothetical protein